MGTKQIVNTPYKGILEHQSTAVILLNRQLHIEYLNNAAEVLLATSYARASQHHLNDIVTPKSSIFHDMEKALHSGQSYTKRETELKLQSGDCIKVTYTITPTSDATPNLILEIFARDRWQQISKEKNLLWQQGASRMLIRGFAHEIKNPLGGIRGAAQLLAKELPNENLHEYTNVIIEEADRLRNLVDQMLGPYRPATFAAVNIHEVLERVASLIHSESNIKIIKEYDPSIPELEGNKEQLIQAVLNIARNAMQAIKNAQQSKPGIIRFVTQVQRQVTIGNKWHKLVCKIDIIDNGPGIPHNIKDTIFYPMVSGTNMGSGLGLTMAQHILNQHGGLIEARSEKGATCFSLTIPLKTNIRSHNNATN